MEQNKKTLIEALSSLREYEPPDSVWEGIQAATALPKEVTELLPRLPQHEPPEQVWTNISGALDAGRSARIVRFSLKKMASVAASVALTAVAVWLWQQPSPVEMNVTQTRHYEETVDTLLLQRDWNEDEAAFQDYAVLCEAKKHLCEQPEFQQLQTELEELTAAKTELAGALGEFGADAGLVLQIKEIELERTDILKKMMAMLI